MVKVISSHIMILIFTGHDTNGSDTEAVLDYMAKFHFKSYASQFSS